MILRPRKIYLNKRIRRNKFILSALALAASPTAVMARSKKDYTRTDKGCRVYAGEGRSHGHIKLQGVHANILVPGFYFLNNEHPACLDPAKRQREDEGIVSARK